ncbi:hypothetical protein T10_9026 [Trichinella papuae]|uniref:Uncharacterized protein n=1 Tax=Trichinella papuae TaxID=268474 RepID=A0A0V1N066_9BILA|nr:hypothetical protein T10_9026 [Trichinella papuae]
MVNNEITKVSETTEFRNSPCSHVPCMPMIRKAEKQKRRLLLSDVNWSNWEKSIKNSKCPFFEARFAAQFDKQIRNNGK